MLDSLKALFYVAGFPESMITVHGELDTMRCSDILSIGLSVRSVKVEALRYRFHDVPQYLVCLHLDSGVSTVLVHNDRVVAENAEAGEVIARLIQIEIDAMVDECHNRVLHAAIDELAAATAIRPAATSLSTAAADEFINQGTASTYATVAEFLSARQV